MADEPSWDDIFRPNPDPARPPQQPAPVTPPPAWPAQPAAAPVPGQPAYPQPAPPQPAYPPQAAPGQPSAYPAAPPPAGYPSAPQYPAAPAPAPYPGAPQYAAPDPQPVYPPAPQPEYPQAAPAQRYPSGPQYPTASPYPAAPQYPPTQQYPSATPAPSAYDAIPGAEAFPGVRATDPFAVAAAEATAQATPMDELFGETTSRRQLRDGGSGDRGRGDRGRGDGGAPGEEKPKRKRRGLLVVLIVVGVLVALVGGGSAYAWLNYEEQVRELLGWELPNDYAGSGNGTEAIVIVESGDFGDDIARKLLEAKVTMTFDAVYDYLVENPEITFEPGNYRLQEQMSAASAVAALQDPANRIINQVLIREGMSAAQAFEQLSAGLGIPLEDFQTAAADFTQFGIPADSPGIEGWLFPATYTFDPGLTAEQVIQTMVDKMFEVLDANGVAPENRLNILKMAALVQREAGSNPDDFFKVARVFYNRLDAGMLFQSDATVAYGTGNLHTVWTTDEERADAGNPYNTYVHAGLPYGPIGLPGELAIQAAISPAEGPWFYFVPINLATGETVFSETVDEHEAAVDQLHAWCEASAENASYCE